MFKLIPYIICLALVTGCSALQQKVGDHTNASSRLESSQHMDAQRFLELARQHQQNNQLIDALNAYEKVIELAPHHYEAYNNMGMIYFMMGEDELGMQFFSEAIKLAPAVSSSHNNLGYALLKQGRYPEAAEALERAVQLDPDNLHARNNLRAAYRQMGCQEGVPCGQRQEAK